MGFPRHSAGTIFDISVRSPRLFVPGCFPPWLDLCVLNGPTAGVTSVSKLVVWWLREQQQQQQQRGEGPLRLFRLSMTFTSWKVAALLYIKLSILPSQDGAEPRAASSLFDYYSSPLLNDPRGFRGILIGVDRCITAKSSLRSQWINFFFAEGNRNNQRDGRDCVQDRSQKWHSDWLFCFVFFSFWNV
jgi:hypothetical protein